EAKVGTRGGTISAAALAALSRHPWPGNVRELRRVVERAVLLSEGAPIAPEHLVFDAMPTATASAPPGRDPVAALKAEVMDRQKERIRRALEQAGGNQARAAELLGVSRRTLINWLDAHGMPRPRKGKP